MKNPPYGDIAQNEFSNAVWEIAVGNKTSQELLQILQTVETEHQRTRNKKWEDRTLDLDILMYGDEILKTETLTLPHPEISKRVFVLQPWTELVDENFQIPTFGKISLLLKNL